MGPRCGMRTTKCQLMVTSLCVMLLGLSIATLSTVTHYGLHFTLISNISLENNSYRVIHHAAFYFGICLSMTLILAALLSSAATVRESPCLTAVGFFCFALAFCGLIPAACWRYTHSTEVEDSMMDVYDLVYEEVRRNTSSFRRHELTAIHEAPWLYSPAWGDREEGWPIAAAAGRPLPLFQFLCCGKHSPFGDTANIESKTCPPGPAHDAGQDCLQEIQDFLKKHMDFVSTILGVTIGFTVYGMILTSFLWFSIHFSNNLDRKGKYILRER
ncbi:tetraspanin-32 isoform X1 [Strix uralensis]|uniref:tetraspanin-32 isoform X1 n=1 Tax=Strix uralensis TaxID=36305 RepID=UPI003DA51A04